MSALHSVLETERRGERARALRQCLATPIVLAAQAPETFAVILRHREWLVGWFAEHAGWKLSVEPAAGFARLHKVPACPDPTRAAQPGGRGDFDRRRYVLLCLTLAAFDEVAQQTTLGSLASRVQELSAEDEEVATFDPTAASERRAFVDVLRLLTELGVLSVRDGDTQRYAQTQEGDALFDVHERLLAHLVSAPIPPALAGTPERMLDEGRPETEEGLRRQHRHHVIRRLIDDPVVYLEDLAPQTADWVAFSRAWLMRLLTEDAGFSMERRAEGLAAIDPSGITADTSFPDGGSTVKHAAILLAEQLARGRGRDTRLVSRDEVLRLTQRLHHDFGERCHWSKQYPADDEGCARLADESLDLLERFGLVSRAEGGWRVRPAIARFRPGTPSRQRPRPQR